jgi:hypothetical protein
MRRVLRYDGLLPNKLEADGSHGTATPDDLAAMKAWIEERREVTTPFDIVWEGETPGDDPARAAEIVRPWAEAGATWWMEARWSSMQQPEVVRERIRQGPPRE